MTGPNTLEARLERIEAGITHAIDTAQAAGTLAIDNARHNAERIEALENRVTTLESEVKHDRTTTNI